MSGHPLAAGRAQDRERPPTKDRRSTTEPTPPTDGYPDGKGSVGSEPTGIPVTGSGYLKTELIPRYFEKPIPNTKPIHEKNTDLKTDKGFLRLASLTFRYYSGEIRLRQLGNSFVLSEVVP